MSQGISEGELVEIEQSTIYNYDNSHFEFEEVHDRCLGSIEKLIAEVRRLRPFEEAELAKQRKSEVIKRVVEKIKSMSPEEHKESMEKAKQSSLYETLMQMEFPHDREAQLMADIERLLRVARAAHNYVEAMRSPQPFPQTYLRSNRENLITLRFGELHLQAEAVQDLLGET